MRNRKGLFGPLVLGIMLVAAIVASVAYFNIIQILNFKVKTNYQISFEQDYKGEQVLSTLSTLSSKTQNKTYMEIVGTVVSNNIEADSGNLEQLNLTIKKIENMEKRPVPLSVKYGEGDFPITYKENGDNYIITLPLPGGEIGQLLIGEKA